MIPVCQPLLMDKELQYVTDCLKTNWISSMGQYVNEFEEKFAAYCGCSYGISTTSGTTALHLALAALGIGKGDEVIVPTFTNAATAFAVVYCGATPVFVDAEADTWNIDCSLIEGKITPRTKAIMPVHIYGHPCDMDALSAIAGKHNLYLVEDAAEAHGAEYKGRKAGSMSIAGCFSFYSNKMITTGEGGMIVTDDAGLAEKARILKNLAFAPEKRFLHRDIGFNYRMTNVQAAIGLAQLEYIDEFVERRRSNAHRYNERLANIKGLRLPQEKDWARNVYWMYSLLIEDEFGHNRDTVMKMLAEKGVETRAFFIPMNTQPAFKDLGFADESCPVAEDFSEKGLYLPSGSGLKQDELDYVCRCLEEISRS